MADLKAQIIQSARDLKAMWTELQATTPSILPSVCYDKWIQQSSMYSSLEKTAAFFPARDTAWSVVESVGRAMSERELPGSSEDGSVIVPFAIARHLALTSHVAVHWAIYDRLANVCGRLAGIAPLAENPKQNPKVCEDFLDNKKDLFGFAGHLPLRQAYAWPVKVTYKVRNWLIHEGYEVGSVPMFVGDTIADGFALHPEAVSTLQQFGGYNADDGKIDSCCLTAAEECWGSSNLLTILPRYYREIDEMFASLIKWSVEAFLCQIKSFVRRS